MWDTGNYKDSKCLLALKTWVRKVNAKNSLLNWKVEKLI